MSLGIKRECLGDIVIKDNKDAFFACTQEISSYLENEFHLVGKASISLILDKVDMTANDKGLRPLT